MSKTFTRDKYFWSIALQTYVVNLFLGGFGPAQPLLREDQHTSLTIAGLHGTAQGVASILAGFAYSKMAHRYGREAVGWIGLWIFGAGLIGLVFSNPVELTLLFTFISGIGVSSVINSFVASFSNHYGKRAPIAIGQANGISSAGYVSGTLIIGLVANEYREFWRYGLLLSLPLILYVFFFHRIKDGDAHVPSEHGPQAGRMSLKFWIAWVGFLAAISTEFATAFWAAALVQDRTGASDAISTIAIVALGVGMGLGRWFGAPVLHRLELDQQLKFVLGVQAFGFAVLWLSHNLFLSIFALLLNGLGLSMQFTLCQLRMIALSDNRSDLATGKGALAAGLAIACAPFALAVLGDHIGISRAYIMVPVIIAITYATVALVPAHLSHEEVSAAEGFEE